MKLHLTCGLSDKEGVMEDPGTVMEGGQGQPGVSLQVCLQLTCAVFLLCNLMFVFARWLVFWKKVIYFMTIGFIEKQYCEVKMNFLLKDFASYY